MRCPRCGSEIHELNLDEPYLKCYACGFFQSKREFNSENFRKRMGYKWRRSV